MPRFVLERREAMKVAGLAAAAAWLGLGDRRVALARGLATRQPGPDVPRGVPRRVVRLSHLTDIHVQPERRGGEGLAACLAHLSALVDKPDLVVTGGDLVFDAFSQERSRTSELWTLFGKCMRDGCGIPVVHTLGNHDIWGWNKGKSKTTGDEPGWGKRWFCEMAGREKTYQAFDRGAWRVIQLDSVQTNPDDANGYIGRIDPEQFAWLEDELRALAPDRHAVVVSHIPIMSACAMMYDSNAKEQDKYWHVSAGNMHIDGRRLHRLFAANGRVRLCLSGHIHKLDRVELDGVTYICNGAVCGSWWQGKKDRCDEGYALVDLFEDGSFRNEYVTYGWKAQE